MTRAKKDLERQQEQRDNHPAREKQRQATREWWKTPSSSSTLAWVHSGGVRGTSMGEVRPWSNQANQSLQVHSNNSTIHLNTTAEEM